MLYAMTKTLSEQYYYILDVDIVYRFTTVKITFQFNEIH